jgi:hypothetical protein
MVGWGHTPVLHQAAETAVTQSALQYHYVRQRREHYESLWIRTAQNRVSGVRMPAMQVRPIPTLNRQARLDANGEAELTITQRALTAYR